MLNFYVEKKNIHSFLKKKIEDGNYSIVAISNLFISEFDLTNSILKTIKDINPKIITILGGYYPTTNYKIIKKSHIDFIIRSEGEYAIYELVRKINNSESYFSIPNLVFFKKGKIIVNQISLCNLQDLPPINYSVLPNDLLNTLNNYNVNLEFLRGCYYNCSICSVKEFWQNTIREHNYGKIIVELQYLKSIDYQGEVSIEDSSVCVKSAKFKNFLSEIIEMSISLNYTYITTRYDLIDAESLRLLKKVGFKNIIFGLESTSEYLLNNIDKHINFNDFNKSLKMVKHTGINTNVFVIIGLPGETKDTLQQTYYYVKKNIESGLIMNVFVSYFLPFSDLKATNDLKKWGGVINRNICKSQWHFRTKPIVEYPGLSYQDQIYMYENFMALNKKSNSAFYSKF